MGTPPFAATVLEALLQGRYNVVAVYTQPDRPAGRGHGVAYPAVKRLSLERGIPVVQPRSLKSGQATAELAGVQPGLIIVAAFGFVLPPEVLSLPGFGCVNVHPSLLPRHRGPSPIASTILCGDEVSGVTIMLMDAGLDTGPVLSQQEVGVSSRDTSGSLGARLADAGARLLLETLPRWLGGEIRPQVQDESWATYSRLIIADDAEIDWRLSALDIWRRVRAYNPWPGCHTWYQGRRLKVHQAAPCHAPAEGEVGEVVSLGESPGVGVVTGDGVLGLCRIQMEGRRDMSADEFVRGRRDFVGSVLGSR